MEEASEKRSLIKAFMDEILRPLLTGKHEIDELQHGEECLTDMGNTLAVVDTRNKRSKFIEVYNKTSRKSMKVRRTTLVTPMKLNVLARWQEWSSKNVDIKAE